MAESEWIRELIEITCAQSGIAVFSPTIGKIYVSVVATSNLPQLLSGILDDGNVNYRSFRCA